MNKYFLIFHYYAGIHCKHFKLKFNQNFCQHNSDMYAVIFTNINMYIYENVIEIGDVPPRCI